MYKYFWKIPGWALVVIGFASIPDDIQTWSEFLTLISPHIDTVTVKMFSIFLFGFLIADATLKIQDVFNIWKSKRKSNKDISPIMSEPIIAPDIDMADAQKHVVSILFPGSDPNDVRYNTEYRVAAKSIVEKLRNGDLIAWGKRIEKVPDGFGFNGTVYKTHTTDKDKLFNKAEWEYRELDPLSASIPWEDKPQTKSFGSNEDHVQFTALRVNLKQVLELWTPTDKTQIEKDI